jgi:DNA-binding NtrC family response regulator
LRERLEDVPLLVNHFLQKCAAHSGTEAKKIDSKAMERLGRYTWPGNVRELENAIERACALCEDDTIKTGDLPPHILHESEVLDAQPEVEWQVGQRLDDFVRNQERKYIEMTLRFNQGSREKTASMLGISIATLYRKLDLKHHRI